MICYVTWHAERLRNGASSHTVLSATLEQLRQKVFDEQLLSETVDVDDVTAKSLTAFLGAVERRRFVDDRVARSSLAASSELGPPRCICAISINQSMRYFISG